MSAKNRSDVKKKFTNYQIETAIKVMMESTSVRNWVSSEHRFLGIDVNTWAGRERIENLKREYAEKLIQ